MEWFPQLESCCCGCSLRTGTIMIGSLGLLGYIIGIVGCMWLFKDLRNPNSDIQMDLVIFLKVLYGLGIFYSSVHIIINSVLLLGVWKKKSNFIKPYVFVSILCVTLIFLMILLLLILGWRTVVIMMILIVMEIYFLYVVNSYYFTMGRE